MWVSRKAGTVWDRIAFARNSQTRPLRPTHPQSIVPLNGKGSGNQSLIWHVPCETMGHGQKTTLLPRFPWTVPCQGQIDGDLCQALQIPMMAGVPKAERHKGSPNKGGKQCPARKTLDSLRSTEKLGNLPEDSLKWVSTPTIQHFKRKHGLLGDFTQT